MELPQPRTIIEPFRIKAVEPIPMLAPGERAACLRAAHFNLFRLAAEKVTFDLLTDSGTSAMSAQQWAALMNGDESYAGARSFFRFEKVVQELTGMEHVIPTHQGRAAEALLMQACLKPGKVVIGNTHFDTTRANIESSGGVALDLPSASNQDSSLEDPFKGNLDTAALARYLERNHSSVAFAIMTATNNSVGGQPVSMANLRETRAILDRYGIPMFLDAARFAENAYFIKLREPGYGDRPVREIAREMFSLAHGSLMSAKKDGFGNIGGFLAVRDSALAEEVRTRMVITEGFPTYGGLTGRDLEALAVGLEEVLDENYLAYRIRSVRYFGEGIQAAGFHVIQPFGGHAVYIDAAKTLSHLPASHFPGQALSAALYEAVGIRSVEVGSVMLGRRDESGEEIPAPKELVRLAMPRRVYTQSHVDYMVEMIGHLWPRVHELPGYELTYQARHLRHFTARFRQILPS